MTRARDWQETLAFARYSLRLEPEEFFAMTPRMLAAIRRLWTAERRELGRMLAVLRTDLINFSFCRPKDPIKVSDLLGSDDIEGVARRGEYRKLTKKQRIEIANAWRRTMGSMASK